MPHRSRMPHATCHMRPPPWTTLLDCMTKLIHKKKTQKKNNKKQSTKKQFVTFVMLLLLLLLLQVSKSIIPRNGTPEQSVATIFNWNTFKTFSIKSRENKSQRRAEKEKERESEIELERERGEMESREDESAEHISGVRTRCAIPPKPTTDGALSPFPTLSPSLSSSLACSFSVCLPLCMHSLSCLLW